MKMIRDAIDCDQLLSLISDDAGDVFVDFFLKRWSY